MALAPEWAAPRLEELMRAQRETFVDRLLAEGEAKGLAEGEARGRAEGQARSLLKVLANRGLRVPARVQEMVSSCADSDQLESWFDKALAADSVEEVFGPDSAGSGPGDSSAR